MATNGVPAWEESLFNTIYGLPDWLEPVLWAPMQLGSVLAPLVVAAASWLAWRRWRPSVGAIVAGIGGWWLAKGIKELVDRGRPGTLLEDLELRAGAPTDGLGFLSGHATVAFALAAILSPYLSHGQPRGRLHARDRRRLRPRPRRCPPPARRDRRRRARCTARVDVAPCGRDPGVGPRRRAGPDGAIGSLTGPSKLRARRMGCRLALRPGGRADGGDEAVARLASFDVPYDRLVVRGRGRPPFLCTRPRSDRTAGASFWTRTEVVVLSSSSRMGSRPVRQL